MTKRFSILLALVAFAAILVPSAAFGNFAIHGNYVNDTDACAGCHRAHTSVSSLTWTATTSTGVKTEHSALLVSSATTMEQFCYACHDSAGQSADTNVTDGVYYGTDYGTQGSILNGGGFESFDNTPTTSSHVTNSAPWGAWGGGYAGPNGATATGNTSALNEIGESNKIAMDCATCHDPHGSANYRILKAQVNGNNVGGYQPSGDPQNPTPDGFVSSVETGWPANGFELHTAYPAYVPNYTTPMYAKGYNMAAGTQNDLKGMSGWCSGCHSTYIGDSTQTFTNSAGIAYQSLASTYTAGDTVGTPLAGRVSVGFLLRHKHPVNVSLSTYNGPDKSSMIVTDQVLPVANDLGEAHVAGKPVTSDGDWVECLTCHRAHGTIAAMSGFAANPAEIDNPLPTFVSPTPSALLRMDNRGVCEACHNK